MEKIRVYEFEAYDIATDREDPRPVKATREKIKELAGATVIEGSGEAVDASMLNGQGFYRPKG
jgi:hypothetical protein